MVRLKILAILISIININHAMYYLTNFHADYPDARVILAHCGQTVSLSCRMESENNSSSLTPTMWFRLYENAYPQPLMLGDRQLIDDQRFMLRTQNSNRHLEIVGVRKDDEGYYLCKSGKEIQSSYNLTIHTNSCIDITPNHIHLTIDDSLQLVCRIHSIPNSNELNIRVKWTRNDRPLKNSTASISNYSSIDGILYETLTIKKADRTDTGVYKCRYGQFLTATAQVIVNQYPGGSKSRRLISQLRGNSSASKASLRTVVDCFIFKQTRINKMIYRTIIALVFCMLAGSLHGAEKCPGASSDSQDDFKWKYDAAPIVAYGTVANVQKNIATLTVNCVLKGQLPLSTVELTQLPEVLNLTECHYLTTNKQYVVFLESLKTAGADGKTLYRLADLEEIEINSNTVNAFLDEECADEDDFGIEMTIFYYNNNLKCGQFTATCNQATKSSIAALNYPPLTKGTTFLGGFKKTLSVPKMEDEAVSGKQSGTGDEQYRGSAMLATICMPLMIFLVGLVMQWNF